MVFKHCIALVLLLAIAVISNPAFAQTRPADHFSESRWQSLDGEWRLAADPTDIGQQQSWSLPNNFPESRAHDAQVPGWATAVFPIDGDEPKLKSDCTTFWYQLTFAAQVPTSSGMHQVLHFDAVRYSCDVWLNGKSVGRHVGAASPFELDVTDSLRTDGPNSLIVRVFAGFMPGIWQHVTLFSRPSISIRDVFARPDVAHGKFDLDITIDNVLDHTTSTRLNVAPGEPDLFTSIESTSSLDPGISTRRVSVALARARLWNLDDPFLYRFVVSTDAMSSNTAGDSGRCTDQCTIRAGLRDFRFVDGWFCLNGKRIFIKSLHAGGDYDPVSIFPTPDAPLVSDEYKMLKDAGFNMMRYLDNAVTPEQLDRADELGFLIYSEHETSWMDTQPEDFGISLNDCVRTDRNHPSLVMWGLRNETVRSAVADRAIAWLPSLRSVDDTRLVMLNSGRFDGEGQIASASNPGSTTWDSYLGGEDAIHPDDTGDIPNEIGAFRKHMGDVHLYQTYPTTWKFISSYLRLCENNKPFFLSEAGIGSSYNPYDDRRTLQRLGAPPTAFAWKWINPAIMRIESAWKAYGLTSAYPTIEDFFLDSALNGARQRTLMFNLVRANPRVNGYSLTSLIDAAAEGEGVMTSGHQFKPGHENALKEGWAPLRFCLLMSPTHAYVDQPLHVKVSLVNEDVLPPGDYPIDLSIEGQTGVVWSSKRSVHIDAGVDSPMAHWVFQDDVSVPGIAAGKFHLNAKLQDKAAASLDFIESTHDRSDPIGVMTTLNISSAMHDFLTSRGASLHDYQSTEQSDHEVIAVGDHVGDAAAWRTLYGHAARGAHILFLNSNVFAANRQASYWLAVPRKGHQSQASGQDWLYHKDCIARKCPVTDGLQTRLMTPEFYEGLLADTRCFYDVSPPEETIAAGIYCCFQRDQEGVMLGTYKHHAGAFTINAFNFGNALGTPAGDRLLLNLIRSAKSDAATVQSLPPNYDSELDRLGIRSLPTTQTTTTTPLD